MCFFRKLLKRPGASPAQLATDRLRSYAAARIELGLGATHRIRPHDNTRTEVSRQHTREGERKMRRFRSEAHVRRALSVHSRFRICFEWRATICEIRSH